MVLTKTSIFAAPAETVFYHLQQLKTLQYIAFPYATFIPIGKVLEKWEPDSVSSYKFRLFGIIPLGVHTIRVERFSIGNGIYTHEGNRLVPVWNHEIILEPITGSQCRYTDRVTILAGWKTPFIYLWAKCFYAHRQRKWKTIINNLNPQTL